MCIYVSVILPPHSFLRRNTHDHRKPLSPFFQRKCDRSRAVLGPVDSADVLVAPRVRCELVAGLAALGQLGQLSALGQEPNGDAVLGDGVFVLGGVVVEDVVCPANDVEDLVVVGDLAGADGVGAGGRAG